MSNIDEKIAKMILNKRIEKEEKEQSKSNIEEDRTKISLEEVCEGIRNGKIIINDKEIIFGKQILFNGKLELPVPEAFFDIKTNTDKNAVFLNDPEGVSFNGDYIAKCAKRQDFNVIKDSVDKNFKNAKLYIEWTEEGKFKLSDSSTVFFAVYNMPTSKGNLYNVLFMRYYKGTLMIGNYNCGEKNFEEWKLIINASLREMKFL